MPDAISWVTRWRVIPRILAASTGMSDDMALRYAIFSVK
jgi:hypothetical protein